MEDAVKKAKRKSSGTGAANPFIGQAIKKPKSRPFGLDNGLYFCGRCEKQVHHVDWEKLCESCAGGTYFVRK